jgi:5'-nucleotidase
MGTAFGAASREIGGELTLMAMMNYDATNLGNHEFDLGPGGFGKSIDVAEKAGRVLPLLAVNASCAGGDASASRSRANSP